MMTEGKRLAGNLLIISMVFLLSQAFTIAKLSRDRYMANMAMSDPTVPPSMKVFLPTKGYVAQVLFFSLASIAAAIYSLTEVHVSASWYGFGLLALIWLL